MPFDNSCWSLAIIIPSQPHMVSWYVTGRASPFSAAGISDTGIGRAAACMLGRLQRMILESAQNRVQQCPPVTAGILLFASTFFGAILYDIGEIAPHEKTRRCHPRLFLRSFRTRTT